MTQESRKHEKVRFRRADIRPLTSLPSAIEHAEVVAGTMAMRTAKWLRRTRGMIFGVAATIAVLVGAVYVAANSDAASDRLRREAQAALTTLLAMPVEVQSGEARFTIRSFSAMGLEIPEVRLIGPEGHPFTTAGGLRFRFAVWPALSGRLDVTSIGLRDARIATSFLPARDGDWRAVFAGEDGLLQPDRATEAVFAFLTRSFGALENRSMRRIALENVEFAFAPGGAIAALKVASAVIVRDEAGRLDVAASLELNGRVLSFSGEAVRRGDGGLEFQATAGLEPTDATTGQSPAPADATATSLAQAALTISGTRAGNGDPDTIRAEATMRGLGILVPRVGAFLADGDLAVALVEGSGKVEIEKLALQTGRSTLRFHGAFGPAPQPTAGAEPAYRYELVSDGSRIAAADASEPALDFYARLAGTFAPGLRQLDVSELGVRTSQGEVIGQAAARFPMQGAPALALALDIPTMPVAHAKQLWPLGAAPGARSWVLANVFGGTLNNSRLRFRVPSGRLGNGVPLAPDEINGEFAIDRARFNITGELPPVRDAVGRVIFGGSDVDVTLSTGTVFMPSGRTVAASDGTFRIRHVEKGPSVGEMDIDVAGDARSVIEFVSYKPIDAMRRLNLKPEDFSGEVSGNVKAQIPLARDFPIENLGWQVALNYRNVAVAQPFEGQLVTEATGTIAVDPAKAVISAAAKLGGVPAQIAMTEPLRPDGPARIRDVTLKLDDAARRRIAPGLDRMVSGVVPVEVSIDAAGKQRLEADLTQAELDIPWAGWTKGPGVAATASFVLAQESGSTRLSQFVLKGETFGAEGEISLDRGSLAEARFGRIALNRGDDASLRIRRSGQGYAIDLDAKAFDARPLVKLYLGDTETAEAGVEAVPIALEASSGAVTGFGGEVMSDLALSFSSTGTKLGALRLSARAAGGAKVGIVNANDGDGRSVRIDSANAGALLRFLNIYEYMQGGSIDAALAARGSGPLKGQIDARNFTIVNDPRLQSLVATPPPDGDGRSLSQAARRELDVSSAPFERGFAAIEKGDRYLSIERGVLRGPVIGATFQGSLYDRRNRMDMTGTFMPAYGVNRLFAEIPLFGQILGNGTDRGLIGITFKLAGDAKAPQLQVNPISVIAPGIFRSIFEFE